MTQPNFEFYVIEIRTTSMLRINTFLGLCICEWTFPVSSKHIIMKNTLNRIERRYTFKFVFTPHTLSTKPKPEYCWFFLSLTRPSWLLIPAYTYVRPCSFESVETPYWHKKKVRTRSIQEQGPEKCASMIIVCVWEKRELKDMCRNGCTIEGWNFTFPAWGQL